MYLKEWWNPMILRSPENGEGNDGGSGGNQGGSEGGKGGSEGGSEFERGSPPGNEGNEGGSQAPELYFEDGFDVSTIPEKFIKDGKIDVGNVLKSQDEAEKAFRKAEKDLRNGKAPDEYKFTAPEIEGMDADQVAEIVSADHPMVQHFNNLGKELGWSQKDMDRIQSEYVKYTIENADAVKEGHIKDLGDGDKAKGQEIVDKNMKFYQANFPEEDFQAISRLAISSEAVKALDTIRQKLMGGNMYGGDGGTVEGGLTEDDLRAKMRSESYYDPNHPDHEKIRNEVEAGFKKLYPGKVSAG